MRCPYCQIDFRAEPWAADGQPKIVCMNCKRYYENVVCLEYLKCIYCGKETNLLDNRSTIPFYCSIECLDRSKCFTYNKNWFIKIVKFFWIIVNRIFKLEGEQNESEQD